MLRTVTAEHHHYYILTTALQLAGYIYILNALSPILAMMMSMKTKQKYKLKWSKLTTSTIDDDDEPTRDAEVDNLEDMLSEKQALIDQLQQTLVRETKMNEDRNLMLEFEVERLIDIRNNNDTTMDGRSSSSTDDLVLVPISSFCPLKDKSMKNTLHYHHDCNDESSSLLLHRAQIEISALGELLSRVIAERDVFARKVNNLERIMVESSSQKDIAEGQGELVCCRSSS